MSGPLFQRSLVAECALQAVQNVDVPTLQSLPLYDEEGNQSTEGFFDSLKSTMQSIGSNILKVAPDVIKNVAPIAVNLLAGAIKPAAGTGTGTGTESDLPGSGTGIGGNGSFTAPVSIATLASSRPSSPSAVSTDSLQAEGGASQQMGFQNLDGVSFRPAPWKD
jgi:hypothetical protein